MHWSQFANPVRFMSYTRPMVPVLAVLAIALCALGFGLGLFYAPPEADQGEVARILFLHVPAAWLSMMVYLYMVVASISYFVWRHVLADLAAATAAPFGAAFALVTLATGSIWGYPTWGTWWEWNDGRLVSMLVLLLIYLGYIAMRHALDGERQVATACAILAMIGAVNLPIIKFSVDWWASLHQPAAVFRFDGPTMPASVLAPLLIAFAGLFCGFLALWLVSLRSAIRERRITILERQRWQDDAGEVPA